MNQLQLFLKESNGIEGIFRDPTEAEITVTRGFLQLRRILVSDIEKLVSVYQPGAVLRDKIGLDVRVGQYTTPRGGPRVVIVLGRLLEEINQWRLSPWKAHCQYEMLHPFTDGNGRSGRAIWLWLHQGQAPLGFLHKFYYETLENQQ